MKTVLGIDQGGSHTWAVAAREDGRLLGLGQAEGACHAYAGMDKAMAEVERAAREALENAKIQPDDVDLALGGLTGADWPEETILLEENILALNIARYVAVTNDSIIALRGGTAQPYGAIMIAGSGGNVAVRSLLGAEYHYGYFHDEEFQGGGGLVRQAFKAIFRAHSFRDRPTILADLFCEHFQLDSVDALARMYFSGKLDDGAGLAPAVFAAYGMGDEAAVKLVTRWALGYAEMARAALLRFNMQHLAVDVVLSGGVFKAHCPQVRQTILADLRRDIPLANLVEARYEPVVGAALLGLERLGVNTTALEFTDHLSETARLLGLVRAANP